MPLSGTQRRSSITGLTSRRVHTFVRRGLELYGNRHGATRGVMAIGKRVRCSRQHDQAAVGVEPAEPDDDGRGGRGGERLSPWLRNRTLHVTRAAGGSRSGRSGAPRRRPAPRVWADRLRPPAPARAWRERRGRTGRRCRGSPRRTRRGRAHRGRTPEHGGHLGDGRFAVGQIQGARDRSGERHGGVDGSWRRRRAGHEPVRIRDAVVGREPSGARPALKSLVAGAELGLAATRAMHHPSSTRRWSNGWSAEAFIAARGRARRRRRVEDPAVDDPDASGPVGHRPPEWSAARRWSWSARACPAGA